MFFYQWTIPSLCNVIKFQNFIEIYIYQSGVFMRKEEMTQREAGPGWKPKINFNKAPTPEIWMCGRCVWHAL